ncbi:urease accessory protein UreF [Pacificimonas flava]|uniref:Urease accessory protein UreF n=2 Tax=Pacificimonas TaxID=1960290 RepID=A0A219B0L8_9SPHN|nr:MULTISPECIES: urease accessory protein UreF [Pacificimonas]MBZ6379628.1 urease accessory protein UreF [Pacificimonas aurantium]OWV31902.1 urease accessory protein UreF [Pacificimonas flava]
MRTDAALHRLLAWTSPAYPVGAFTYSHGLETAVETGEIASAEDAASYIRAVIEHGSGWVDAVLFAHSWRSVDDEDAVDELAELAAAFRGSRETALECHQQGRAFLAVTRKAWPHTLLDSFAERHADRPMAQPVIMGLAAAVHGVPLVPALAAFLHGTAANLVSAAVRLVPLGQTDGQIVTADLAPVIDRICTRAQATDLDDLGTAAPRVELASLHHETLYTRLFRS